VKQAILFDVDGVLIHGYTGRAEFRRCWDKNLEADLGISRAAFKENFIMGPFTKEVLVGRKTLQDALAETMPGIGYHGDVQVIVDYWLEKDSCLNHTLLEKIIALKNSGQVRLFVATNQEHNRARYLMEQLELDAHFEDIFHSARIGAAKPDMTYFENVTALLDLPDGHKPIFFDDCPAVISAANAHGWQAHEFHTVDDLTGNDYVRDLLAAGCAL